MEGIADNVLMDILSRAVGPERARIAFDALSLPPSVSIRVNPYKFRSDQKGLCDELFAEAAGLASPDRGRPRHARGRGPDRRRGGENLFSQTLREMGGASRSEESGLPEPAARSLSPVEPSELVSEAAKPVEAIRACRLPTRAVEPPELVSEATKPEKR